VYVTDFYVRDITCLQGVFAGDSFSQGNYEWLARIAERTGAVAAVNGDFCTMRKYGIVVRNGKLYRSTHSSFDACAIYWDGTMETYYSDDWNGKDIAKRGAYLAFSFGPKLLDKSGQPLKKFNQTDAVIGRNPRTAIGYFEPGHYCFVTVDGRTSVSRGLTLGGLSNFMASLGCKAAYNLDGGESASLWFMGDIVSQPYNDGRKISDALILKDLAED
jgi:exopolysaccharide biosynthesis protein